jgi:putative transposase
LPPDDAGGGAQLCALFQPAPRRTGTLWEGRYRSTLIQTERYLLACMVYIDLNPVRAGMVAQAADYPWSSHAHYIGRQRIDKLVTPHALYLGTGQHAVCPRGGLRRIGAGRHHRGAADRADATALERLGAGRADFVADLQKRTARRVTRRRAGRPVSIAFRQKMNQIGFSAL